METKLLDLPEECLSKILSLTSPIYILRCTLVCKLLNSIANSDDLVWQNSLPSDLQPLINRSLYPSTKTLVLNLCRSFTLLDDSNMSFSLDKWTGKKSYEIGARRLTYAPGDDVGCWRWKPPFPESRFLEVAELLGVNELHITGRASTHWLSPNTTYRIYFSFMLEDYSTGFDVYPVRVFVSRIDKNGVFLGGSYDASKTFYLKAPAKDDTSIFDAYDGSKGEDTFKRDNDPPNWVKIDMGKYFNGGDSEVAELEMTLMGTEIGLLKSGLIVHAIELQPVV